MLQLCVVVFSISLTQSNSLETAAPNNPTLNQREGQNPALQLHGYAPPGYPADHQPDILSADKLKRVFLSRGWGPGGYEVAPAPPPFARPNQHPPSRRPRRPHPADLLSTGGHKASLSGWSRRHQQKGLSQDDDSLQPHYQRFHSIFTSGTWSPLGKRSNYPNQNTYLHKLQPLFFTLPQSQQFPLQDDSYAEMENVGLDPLTPQTEVNSYEPRIMAPFPSLTFDPSLGVMAGNDILPDKVQPILYGLFRQPENINSDPEETVIMATDTDGILDGPLQHLPTRNALQRAQR